MIDKKTIDVVELFAGVGGFRVGLERCSKDTFHTIWANQWEPNQTGQWAYKCYEANFGSDSHCVNADIATVINEVPKHDLLVGGFPCQDYSVAHSLSSSKGIEGKKGVLWWSINDIVRLRHPRYILLENVDRLLKSPAKQRGRDFGVILRCLADEGYAVEWRVINAAEYGNTQRRRRTFIFAFRKDTKFYQNYKSELAINSARPIFSSGFFVSEFPVIENEGVVLSTKNLNEYADVVELSDKFSFNFHNSGYMLDGIVSTVDVVSCYFGEFSILRDILEKCEVDSKYYVSTENLEKWKYMKGSKKIERVSKEGFTYTFSEGSIAFPDPIDKPARTMLTSEGTKNRSSHIIADPHNGKYRILTPLECERINGFPDGWTDTGMPERQRYFIMGNALVVPLIEKMAHRIIEII